MNADRNVAEPPPSTSHSSLRKKLSSRVTRYVTQWLSAMMRLEQN